MLPLIQHHPFLTALIVAALLGLLVLWLLVRYGLSTWSTPEEVAMALPGDDLIAKGDQVLVDDQAITIHAPASAIWPHMIQTGQDRAGFYSFDWLERLCTFDIHNDFTLRPQWVLKPGDIHIYHQWGIGTRITEVVPGQYFRFFRESVR